MSQNSTEDIQQTSVPNNQGTASALVKKLSSASVKLSDIGAIALKNWYWFFFSLLICLGYAWFSIQKTVPLYTQSTSVLLRDNVEGSGTGSSSIDMRELGINTTTTVLDDEMEALRSPDLMEQVVTSLNLATLYSSPGRFHPETLYGSTLPVMVSFPDMQPEETASFNMEVNRTGEIKVSDLRVNGDAFEVNPEMKVEFGDAILSPAGRIVIQKSPFYQEDMEYNVDVVRLSLENATQKFGGEISVERSANKRSNVIEILCTDANIQRADDILAQLMKCYAQNWLKSRAEVVATTNDFITQRLQSVESELSGVDNSISNYKSSNLIPDVSQTSSMFMQQSNDMSNQIMNYNNQLQMARYLKNYISTEGKNQMLPVNTGLANTNIEGLIAEYNSILTQRNSIIGNTSENNPLIIEYDSRLAALRSNMLASIDNSIMALSTTIQNMERREQSSTARVAASPQQARVLLSAERKQKVQENLYLYLLQKREENELSKSFIPINTRILRQPSGSKAPTSPKPQQTYLIALLIGFAVPLGSIYLIEVSNTKVRGRKDVEEMSVPIVGEIPKFKKSGKKKVSYFKGEGKKRKKESISEDIVVEDGNRNLVNEAIRVLRSNITRMTGEQTPTVIMVTSFNPGSGKTFITVNLGLTLALKRHKVLLIDGDLRRASLSKFAGNPRKGLSDYLSGICRDIDTVIQKDTMVEGLDILPVGAIPPNPTELLESARFKNLIEYLRTEYDYIFIDCPPGEMMADAQIIADVADRTLFVIRVGLFQRSMLTEVERLYQTKKYPSMMIVLNDSVTGSRYGYSYSYGYGYHRSKGKYGYDYK